jgi:hypothetical protein
MPPETENPSRLKTILAIGGLLVSLTGNFIQYGTLKAKRVELDQKQQELNSKNAASLKRSTALDDQLAALNARMADINDQMVEAEHDNSRGQMAMVYAPIKDRPYARQIFLDSITTHERLVKEKKELQQQIDQAIFLNATYSSN